MAATFTFSPAVPLSIPGQMRPLSVLRDLPAVADLIELCFSNTLDPQGRSYIEQMRRSGGDSSLLNWAPRLIESVTLPLSGFVWEADGQIVGNVSLIPFSKAGAKIFLIANVATHPKYRRRGIARALTTAAMQRAREKYADALWLHVREDNPGAIALYRDLGFYERTRRTTWQASLNALPLTRERQTTVSIRLASSWDWSQQKRWLEACYPSKLDWYYTHKWSVLRPGLVNGVYRFLTDTDTLQWAAHQDNRLAAVLSYQRSAGRSDTLWLAAPRRPNPQAITALLLHGRRALSDRYSLSLEYPTGVADDAIREAGFLPYRTLVWMETYGTQPRP